MFIDREHGKLKAGIHYTTFAQISALVCCLDESALAVESQSWCTDETCYLSDCATNKTFVLF